MRILLFAFAWLIALGVNAQSTIKTSTFIVKGNCEDCKAKIENAADIKGVKVLTWNEKTKVATVTYDEQKVKVLTIQQAIAASGYDAGDFKGDQKAYNKLPKCCKYRDGVCENPGK
jgi:copper chaperone CopZ